MSYPTSLEGMQSKLDDMIQRKNATMQSNVRKIEHDIRFKVDYLVPTNASDALKFSANGKVNVCFDGNEFELHPHALKQLAGRYKIPTKYAFELSQSDWGRQLLRETFMEHKINTESKYFLIREVDGVARAVLSQKFRRMDSNLIYKSFIESANENGAILYDALHTDTKTHLSAVIPYVYETETENNGTLYSLFGTEIRNSDFGGGALECKVTQINLICDNGLTSESLLRQVHLGAKLDSGINFSLETHTYDTKTQASQVRDIINQSLSVETLNRAQMLFKSASQNIIDIDTEIKKLPALGLQKHEIELVNSNLKNNRESDGLFGGPSRWKFSQAINSISRELEPERKKDIDDLAGHYIGFNKQVLTS